MLLINLRLLSLNMASQWEVVNRKKHRGESGKANRNQERKKNVETKVEEIAPIQESQTMFDAFLEKERKKVQLDNKANNNVSNAKGKEGGSQPKKKNQEKKKPLPKGPSLEEGIKALNVEEMRTHLATVEVRFPEAPMFWLQDLASYVNVKLDMEISDPFFSSKPIGYPSCLISAEIHKLFRDTINRCPLQTLQNFFEFCLQSMIQDSVKGLNTTGYRIFLQCLAEQEPEIVLEAIQKCVDFRNSYQNRQPVCLSILWAAGQAGNKNLAAGLKVWSELMFPVLGTKAYPKYVIDYLDKLLSHHKSAKLEKSVLNIRDLFPILDYIHSTSGLPGNIQKQLQALYPTLKALSYGPEPCNVLRSYFPSFLRRLEPNCSPSLKKEVLTSLVECLVVDKISYSVWRQLYTKHLVQSSILISHLHDEWDNLPSSFPKKLLCETLSAFQVTNEELKGKGKMSNDVKNCVTACKAVLNKMNAQRFPWLKVLLFVAVLVTSLLAYDVQQSGSFKSSKTGQVMKDVGLLAICEQAWGKITVYTGKTLKWLEINVPIFSTWLSDTFSPYIHLFWEKLFNFSLYIWNSTEGIRSWANTNIPPILRIVSDNLPIYMKSLSKYVESIVLQFSSFSYSLLKSAQYYSSAATAWLHKHVLTGSLSTENLQKYAGNTVQAFQEYTLTTYNWISKYVATVIYPGK